MKNKIENDDDADDDDADDDDADDDDADDNDADDNDNGDDDDNVDNNDDDNDVNDAIGFLKGYVEKLVVGVVKASRLEVTLVTSLLSYGITRRK